MSSDQRAEDDVNETPLCEHKTLTLDDTHVSWALGRVCLHCARTVRVVVEHY